MQNDKILNDLLERYSYNPKTGIFIHLKSPRKNLIGKQAGSKNSKGYIQLTLNKKQIYAHRLAVLYMTGKLPKEVVDHKNLKRDDNRWSNLRECSHAENLRNGRMSKNNTVGHKGISRNKHGFMVRICIGTYKTLDEAIKVYEDAIKIYHGEFARPK